MSDDLIKRLEQYSKPGRGDDHPQAVACREAKDRIEQLERENEKLGREVNMAKYGEPNFAWSIHNAAMDDLQAKLTKAVEALQLIAGVKGPYSFPFPEAYEGYGSFAIVTSRETLAELEGEE